MGKGEGGEEDSLAVLDGVDLEADGVFAGRSVFETSAVESPSRCDMKIA
jgi:hypothetical protein